MYLDNKKFGLVIKRFLIRYGLVIVLLISLPFILYLGIAIFLKKELPVATIDKPWDAAVRSFAGPGLASEVQHIQTPKFVKGIYVSAATSSSKKRMGELIDLVDQTELISMVIDVKDSRGNLAFIPRSESLKLYVAKTPTLGLLREFTAPFKEKNIYLIARIFVFQDPALAEAHPEWSVIRQDGELWRDYRGIPWLDPASKNVWRYNAAIAREVFAGGFDEVQFDYIRFPSDGDLKTMVYSVWDKQKTKTEIMSDFFTFLDRELRVGSGIPISVDLFGLTMWQHDFDLNIGQKLTSALPHFDFISPMVYPSHYPDGFNGYSNPADMPYEVVYQNMVRGQEAYKKVVEIINSDNKESTINSKSTRMATFRPWIQDFNLGAVYTPEMVRAQMTATTDGGGSGWLLWNARNVYTVSAFESEAH